MALKVSTGVSRKIGLPEYCSVGASCHVEFELDSSLLNGDLQSFHEQIRDAYIACCQAVNDELSRQESNQQVSQDVNRNSNNGHDTFHDHSKDQPNGSNRRVITDKQRNYINGLVAKIKGFGNGKLDQLTNRMYGKRVDEISSLEASGLIDTLKAIGDGKLDVTAAMQGGKND